MTWLTLRLLLRGGRARAGIVAVCAALVTALLLVAGVVLLLPEEPREALMPVLAEPGTRTGFVLGVLLLVLPPVLLLYQAVRLGTAAREERLAGLRLAGATPGDVRRLAALEVGLPALLGALVGVLLFGGLRAVLGGDQAAATDFGTAYGTAGQLVPTSVTPPWWLLLGVVAGVGGLGGLVGTRIGSRLALSPHGVARHRPGGRPRPWGLLLVSLGAVLFVVSGFSESLDVLALAALALAVLGVLSLSGWVVHVVGARVVARTARPSTLLAAGRLVADPRPAWRAAAAVGGIGLVAGAAAGFSGDLLGLAGTGGYDLAYYLVPVALIGGCLVIALLVVCATLAVHSVESLTDRRRSVAAQSAQGVTGEDLHHSLRTEISLASVPLGAGGATAGFLAYVTLVLVGGSTPTPVLWALGAVTVLAVPSITWLSGVLVARMLRPVVLAASSPEHLRTA